MSTLCHEILNVLSSNEHVAARMAKDPALRAAVVGEVRRQLFGWNSAGSDNDDNGQYNNNHHDDDHDNAVQSPSPTEQAWAKGDYDGTMSPRPPPRSSARQRRRQTGRGGGGGSGGSDRQWNGLDSRKGTGAAASDPAEMGDEDNSGDGYYRVGDASGATAVGAGAGEVDAVAAAEGSEPANARGMIAVDPFYAALTLRTLGNVMKASRGNTPSPTAAARAEAESVSSSSSSSSSDWGRNMRMPFPVRLLYGGNRYGGGASVGGEEGGCGWPLEARLVGDIAELMLSVSERGGEGVRYFFARFDVEAIMPFIRQARFLLHYSAAFRHVAIIIVAVTIEPCFSDGPFVIWMLEARRATIRN